MSTFLCRDCGHYHKVEVMVARPGRKPRCKACDERAAKYSKPEAQVNSERRRTRNTKDYKVGGTLYRYYSPL